GALFAKQIRVVMEMPNRIADNLPIPCFPCEGAIGVGGTAIEVDKQVPFVGDDVSEPKFSAVEMAGENQFRYAGYFVRQHLERHVSPGVPSSRRISPTGAYRVSLAMRLSRAYLFA